MSFDLSSRSPKARQALLIGLIVLVGLVLGAAILMSKKTTPATETAEAEVLKGPHGGRLFTEQGYGLELSIFEAGVPPQFRIYTYRDGKPLDPALSRVTLSLTRLGRKPQTFRFTPQADYLQGDAVVEEPHSFVVAIAAEHGGKSYRFGFDQVEARVAMSPAQMAANGVQLASAGPARIALALPLQGEVRLNEDRTVRVVPRLAGRVESVAVNAGDRVRRGQVLAVLSSQSLADQRSDWLAAQKRLALARKTHAREKQLWEEKISAEQDVLQAEQVLQEAEIAEQSARQKLAALGAAAATGDLTRYEVRAPIDGVITDKQIAVGAVVQEDANIFVVSDLSTVWVEMNVYAKDLNTVKVGQPARVEATAFAAQAQGRVSYVGALVGAQTRVATARLVLPNPQGLWRPGLAVKVELRAGEVSVPLAVAADAVQSLNDWTVVFLHHDDQFEAQPVELGRSDGQWVEVLAGLEPGTRYAARNSYLIKADIGKSGASHDH